MSESTEPILSRAGQARRDEILGVLHGAMAGRVRRRRVVRGLALAMVVGGGVWATLRAGPGAPSPVNPAPSLELLAEAPFTLKHASLRIVGPQDHPPASITIIDDDTMLRALRELGQPTGIIRTGGRVMLTRSFWPASEEPEESDTTG